MSSRLIRSVASFVIVLAAYWGYALCAVPMIEPEVRVGKANEPSEEDRKRARQRGPDRYKKLLTGLFPEGAWERQGPKVLESEQAMLLLEDHHPTSDGRMKLTPCTVIFFPKPRDKLGSLPKGRAIILRAREGAELQFDSPLDVPRGKIGRLVGGRLPGKVVISGRESSPGAGDELQIVTSNVQMNEHRIETSDPVKFRFGPNRGSGRHLIISLLPAEDSGKKKHGPAIGGIKSVELVHLDKIRLQLEGRGLLPGITDSPAEKGGGRPNHVGASRATAKTSPVEGSPSDPDPVEVTCRGPFLFDVVNRLATFEDCVDVTRINVDGLSDQMSCELLEIHFASKDRPNGDHRVADRTRAPGIGKTDGSKHGTSGLPVMKPRQIVAVGHPVVVRAPSAGASARGERLVYEIKSRRLRLEGEQPVTLHHGPHRIEAAWLEYEPAESGRLGRASAAGPGSCRGPFGKDGSETFTVRWKRQLRLRPDGPHHVISVTDGAHVHLADTGGIQADEIHLWLVEQTRKDTDPSTTSPTTILPHRMMAVGHVHIDSPQLTGTTGRLEAWFQHAPASAENVSGGPRPADPAAAARGPADQPPAGRQRDRQGKPPDQFRITGDVLRIEVLRQGKQTLVKNVTATGRVRFVQTRTAERDQLPLTVTGRLVEVLHASSPDAAVSVVGSPAEVKARGLTMTGNDIRLHRGQNRLWIDGPGRVILPIDRDLHGQPLRRRESLSVTWQGGMNFDGHTLHFDQKVAAEGENQWLTADTVDVTLSRRIDFAAPPKREEVDVRVISCDGGVCLENRARLKKGAGAVVPAAQPDPFLNLASIDRLQVRNLRIDQHTGDIRAEGPGWVRTVRRGWRQLAGRAPGGVRGRPAAEHQAPSPNIPEDRRLTYLHVDFSGDITGNLHRHEIQLQRQVKATYGPVDHWDETIEADSGKGLGEDGALLTCDRLQVVEIGAKQNGQRPVELHAVGNTYVEAQRFTARGHRITYVQAKDLLVLEGDGRVDAELWHQTQVGGARSPFAARRILCWPGANRVEVGDARHLDCSQLGL